MGVFVNDTGGVYVAGIFERKFMLGILGVTGRASEIIDTLRVTFTSNVKPLTKFLILQLYSVLKYIKQLLNLCSLGMI